MINLPNKRPLIYYCRYLKSILYFQTKSIKKGYESKKKYSDNGNDTVFNVFDFGNGRFI